MDNRHLKKSEKAAFVKEWAKAVELLKRSYIDLSKIKLAPEVR